MSHMSTFKILSIVIPSYNMDKYLHACCSSMVVADADLLSRLEVLVINDGSNDKTSEIGHDFERKYPGVFRCIDKTNGHYGSCVNRGISEASGTFVKIVDADDSLYVESLGKLLKYLATIEESDIDLIITDIDQVDENGFVTGKTRYGYKTGEKFNLEYLNTFENILSMHGICYRLDMIRKINYSQSEGILYTDGEWIAIPGAQIRNAAFLDIVLYRYLVGRGGQSVSAYASNIAMVEHLFRTVSEYGKKTNFTGAPREYIDKFLCHIARKIYNVYIFEVDRKMAHDGFKAFDNYVNEHVQTVYRRIKPIKIATFVVGGIDILDNWRRHDSGKGVLLTIPRFYRKFNSLCKRGAR